ASMTEQARNAYLQSEADSVKMPYLILGLLIVLVTILIFFTKMPDNKEEGNEDGSGNPLHAFRHRHLTWAVVAQFFYVGAQVCVSSFFIVIATQAANITETAAANYLGLGYGLAFMGGRFAG